MSEVNMISCSERLYEWVIENGLQDDPERIVKVDDEAQRRWGHKMVNHRISQIVGLTLQRCENDGV